MEEAFRQTCSGQGWEFGLAYAEGPGHATTLASEALGSGFRKIVAVGGDGTVNEVAQTLVHSPAAMGIIPKGSGNGLARHLGIPVQIDQALNSVFTSIVVAMDTFRINGKLSLNVSGIVFDGYV